MIRPRRDDDLPRLTDLLRTTFAADAYPARWPSDPPAWIAGRGTLAAWVDEEDTELVGHAALTSLDPERSWRPWLQALDLPPERLGVVRRLFVDPGRRRSAVATALLRSVEHEAVRRDLHLVLDVAEHNHAAIAFWKRHGWREVGGATLRLADDGWTLPLRLFVAPYR